MYVLVTGAAGFIGSNIVKALNDRGVTEIIAVDNLTKADKFRNLVDCEVADFLDKRDFLEKLNQGYFDGIIDAVLHEGACSDTMETDGRYMMENNYRYSLNLLDWCQDQDVPFLYASSASVYGGGSVFKEERSHEGPLNVYGAGITKTAKNPNAAKLWTDYILSKRGQQIIAGAADLGSIRTDVEGDMTATSLAKTLGNAVRPIPLSTDLLVYLDQTKRLDFIKQWQGAIKGGK